MRKTLSLLFVTGLFTSGVAAGQTWPDFHLTNGTHYTTYGVETYDPVNPTKNLYVDGSWRYSGNSRYIDESWLFAGNNLSDIHDSNQVYLNGGGLSITGPLDVNDFTWNSGALVLDGGEHNSLYGLNTGSEKTLYIGGDVGSVTLRVNEIGDLPEGNKLSSWGSRIFVHNLTALSSDHYFNESEVEVSGTFSWNQDTIFPGSYGNKLILRGSSARWNDHTISAGDEFRVFEIRDGAKAIGTEGRFAAEVLISGVNSELNLSGSVRIDDWEYSGQKIRIESGGVMTSSGGTIGSVGPGAGGNGVEVSGVGSKWVNNGRLDLYVSDKLIISDGGEVLNDDAFLGYSTSERRPYLEYDPYGNSVTVSGYHSKWHVDGSLTLGGPGMSWENEVTVANGGHILIQDELIIYDIPELTNPAGPNLFHLNQGGRLTIGADFDASMEGFNYNAGGTLAVEGQLTGLSTLEIDRRLDAANVLGDMAVHGTFAPGKSPAESILDGILTVASDGTLEMELAGLLLGDEYDRLTVTDSAYLDGTLDVVLLDGFTLSYGDTFDLFNWDGGVVGEFDTITTSALAGDLEWDTSELYTTGVVTVVPEPGQLSMLALVGGCGWFVRRRFLI